MTLRSFRDLEVICYHPKLPPAKLFSLRVISLRVTWYAYLLFTWGSYPRMVYKYDFIHNSNRLHSIIRFVWDITSQGQMSLISRARASGSTCLKQTLLHAWWASQCTFHVYYFGLLGEHLRQVSWSSGHLLAIYIRIGVCLHRVRAPPTWAIWFWNYSQTA